MSRSTNLRAWQATASDAYEPAPTPEAMRRAADIVAEARAAGLHVDEVDTDATGGMSLRFFDSDRTRGRYAWVACLNSGETTCVLVLPDKNDVFGLSLDMWARIKEYLGR